jgi:hypothetical protein
MRTSAHPGAVLARGAVVPAVGPMDYCRGGQGRRVAMGRVYRPATETAQHPAPLDGRTAGTNAQNPLIFFFAQHPAAVDARTAGTNMLKKCSNSEKSKAPWWLYIFV